MNQTFFKSLTFIILSSFLQASDSLLDEIESLGTLTQVPKMHLEKGSRATDNPRAIYFDALPYEGKNTRSYAWLGLPKKTVGKVPGVVLVHGGGGTAYKEWVQHWNRNGFAAISIAVEGQTDRKISKEGQK